MRADQIVDVPVAVTTAAVDTAPENDGPAGAPLVEEDLLVEDVSIDGMCGVY